MHTVPLREKEREREREMGGGGGGKHKFGIHTEKHSVEVG